MYDNSLSDFAPSEVINRSRERRDPFWRTALGWPKFETVDVGVECKSQCLERKVHVVQDIPMEEDTQS